MSLAKLSGDTAEHQVEDFEMGIEKLANSFADYLPAQLQGVRGPQAGTNSNLGPGLFTMTADDLRGVERPIGTTAAAPQPAPYAPPQPAPYAPLQPAPYAPPQPAPYAPPQPVPYGQPYGQPRAAHRMKAPGLGEGMNWKKGLLYGGAALLAVNLLGGLANTFAYGGLAGGLGYGGLLNGFGLGGVVGPMVAAALLGSSPFGFGVNPYGGWFW